MAFLEWVEISQEYEDNSLHFVMIFPVITVAVANTLKVSFGTQEVIWWS